MFLSKIWSILVGLLAGIAVTAAFVAPRPADRRIEQLEGQRLDRAQYAAEQMLKNEARRWIDYVAKLGSDGKLIDALDSATRGAGELRALHDSVRNRLRELVPDRQAIGAESIIAVDAKGRVVARVGDDESEFGESIAGAEVVADALRGYLSDDVWGAANRLRRIGAAPVLSKTHDRIVGALVVTVETGKRLADLWKRNLGVEVAMVLGKTVLSSTLPEALLAQLPDIIEEHSAEIASHQRTRALPLYMGNERLLTVAAPFGGEAAQQRAYYVLLTKKSPESDPWALLSSTSSDDLKWGRFPWLSLGMGMVALIGIGLFLQRMEIELPLRRLRSEVHGLSRQELHKIDDTKYSGQLGGIARDVNATIEHFTHSPMMKGDSAKKGMGALLDPKLAHSDGRSYDMSATPPLKPVGPPDPAAMAASLFGTPKSAPSLPATIEAPTPTPFVVPTSKGSPPTPSPLRAGALPPPPPPIVSTASVDVVSERGLLPAPLGRTGTTSLEGNPDEAHFRQVFDSYLATRKKCGESVVGLTLEKFAAKLESNREQLVSKYHCRTARFTVYEKDGKAAIRAVPVRD